MKRLRLFAVVGLLFTLGCMCGDFQQGFQQGTVEAMQQGFADAEVKVLALPESPARKRVLELCTRGQADAGKMELVEGSLFLGELEAAIGDGALTDDEAATLTDKYNALVGA